MVYRCFQQWSVEYSLTRRSGSGRPLITDARQDRNIVRAAVAARTASKEVIRAYGAPCVSPRIIENCLLTAGLTSRETLAMLPFTPRQRQAQLLWCVKESTGVEWLYVVFSDESRFCLYANDGHMYG